MFVCVLVNVIDDHNSYFHNTYCNASTPIERNIEENIQPVNL